MTTERLTPDDIDIQLNLGILAVRAGRHEEALWQALTTCSPRPVTEAALEQVLAVVAGESSERLVYDRRRHITMASLSGMGERQQPCASPSAWVIGRSRICCETLPPVAMCCPLKHRLVNN